MCLDEFVRTAFDTLEASNIPRKLAKIQERSNAMKSFRSPQGKPLFQNMCFTQADVDELADDLAKTTLPNWKDECTEPCTIALMDVLKGVLVTVVLFLLGVFCSCCSIVPLCMLCCCACRSEPAQFINAPIAAPLLQEEE